MIFGSGYVGCKTTHIYCEYTVMFTVFENIIQRDFEFI
jgi:hypothetical protein